MIKDVFLTLRYFQATNMIIDDRERLVTMATEESSVVAAVCNTAKQCRNTGGFRCSTTGEFPLDFLRLIDGPVSRLFPAYS